MKPNIFEIFGKKLGISGNMFRQFYVMFVPRPSIKIRNILQASIPLAALPSVSTHVVSWIVPITQNMS